MSKLFRYSKLAAIPFLGVAILFGCGKPEKKENRPPDSPQKTQEKHDKKKEAESNENKLPKGTQPDFILALDEISKVVEGEPDHDRFKNKTIQTTGFVETVLILDRGKSVAFTLSEATEPSATKKNLGVILSADATSKGHQLSRRQKVKVTGKLGQFILFGNSNTLLNSDLEELSKSETLHVTAKDLANEFTDDANAALKKYSLKDVIISGEIEEITKGEANTVSVSLKGNQKIRVRVFFGLSDADSYLKAGQILRVRSDPVPGRLSADLTKTELKIHSCWVLGAK